MIEGHYGNITLHNQTNLSDNLAYSLLGGLNSGDEIASAPLEHRLLLLSDLPGVDVKSTLVPGASVGASDLIVDITPGQRVTGEVDADNAGNRYTGEYRGGATVNLNNPLGLGDVASLRVMTSGAGLSYGRASYQLQLGKAKVGVAYSILRYELGEEFESLHANGTAQVASIFGSYPLIRSRNTNLYAGLAYDYKIFQDRVDTTNTVTDKSAHVLMSSLSGDLHDNFGGGGVSSYSLTWTTGNLDIQTAAAHSFDAVTAKSDGQYNKFGYSLMRLQNVTESVSLYGAINGQFALNNLDVSEKMELGGMYAVRAYPEGETYADEGFVATLEARLLLPKFSERLPGQMHLIGLVDVGSVTVNKDPWTPAGVTLAGAGTATFDTKDVGTDKTITFSGFTLAQGATQTGGLGINFALPVTCCGPIVSRTTANITPAPLTIKANDATKIYGATPTLSTSAFTTPVAPVNGETITGVTETSLGTPANANVNVVGSPYLIKVTPGSATGTGGYIASNYDITYATGNLAVTPAHLTVTADNKTRLYGGTNPVLTDTITGYVNNENATSATPSNYTTTYDPGALTVLPQFQPVPVVVPPMTPPIKSDPVTALTVTPQVQPNHVIVITQPEPVIVPPEPEPVIAPVETQPVLSVVPVTVPVDPPQKHYVPPQYPRKDDRN